MTLKQKNWQVINGVIKALITPKIEKMKKKFVDFFESLGQSLLKFNDLEAISK